MYTTLIVLSCHFASCIVYMLFWRWAVNMLKSIKILFCSVWMSENWNSSLIFTLYLHLANKWHNNVAKVKAITCSAWLSFVLQTKFGILIRFNYCRNNQTCISLLGLVFHIFCTVHSLLVCIEKWLFNYSTQFTTM